jgi:hypothetical protein
MKRLQLPLRRGHLAIAGNDGAAILQTGGRASQRNAQITRTLLFAAKKS